ncbi:MAG: hypothetical protein Q4Q04_05260 [Methanocorpusculum sp.]|nr:hypothetical protein [Methanocorpusculum sp.]
MTLKVVYFTRTGNSRRIAEKIASRLGSELIELKDTMDWSGPAGYIRGGYYASANKDVEIRVSGELNADEYIAVTPLWAGKIVPAFSMLFKNLPKEKVHLVVSSGGSLLKDREGYRSVTDITHREKNEDERIASLVQKLSA